MSKEQKTIAENTENRDYASDISNRAICSSNAEVTPKLTVPKITVSLTDPEGVNKRYSTGSDYADWGHRFAKQDGDIGKFFDGMGLDRGVLEPMLSIQYANVHPASSSSLNLLESASNAGCILDTDQDNCDRRSDLGLPGIDTPQEIIDPGDANTQQTAAANKQRQPTPEDTNNRILQWLTTVTPTNTSQDDAT